MSIRHNSSQSPKTQAFRNVIRCGVYGQTQHNTDFLHVLCLQLRPPKTTQMSAPPPPGEWGKPLAILMFTMSFFGTLFKWSFGVFGGDIGCQYWEKWVQNDGILRSESCLAHLLEIALPPRREHHFHCFERSPKYIFLNTFLKAYFDASIWIPSAS